MIDTKMFATSLSSESKYSKQYAANVSAINTLVAKIEAHPHRSGLDLSDGAKTKPDILRQLLIEAEGDYQSLQQESENCRIDGETCLPGCNGSPGNRNRAR